MILSQNEHAKLDAMTQSLKAKAVPFAMATVVRTLNATSAKPGGKALLDKDGNILLGWIGGGCARSAVARAAREAIASGAAQFISLRPQELLESDGLSPGELRDGVRFARNGCPSQGTMDIFIEPVLPLPLLSIFGTGLVALALAELGARFDFHVTLCVPEGATSVQGTGYRTVEGFEAGESDFIVIATQGQGDLAGLRAAILAQSRYISFVGSRRKFQTLAARLIAEQPDHAERIRAIHAPAGLDIHAITPDEIALSILAQIIGIRRACERGSDG